MTSGTSWTTGYIRIAWRSLGDRLSQRLLEDRLGIAWRSWRSRDERVIDRGQRVKEHAPFYDQVARYMVIFIQGVCSLAECRSFVSKCSPVGTALPPSARDHFQHHDLVNVSTHGFQTPYANRVDILDYWGEVFAQRGEFTDAYTFHVCKHCIKTMPEHCVPTFTVNYVKRADVL